MGRMRSWLLVPMLVLCQGRGPIIWFVGVNFVGFAATLTPQSRSSSSLSFELGLLPPRWTDQSPDCVHAPAFRVHEYNPTFFILRQSGCTHFEKPFLYLLLGSKEALLVDTGAPGADVAKTVGELVRRKSPQRANPLPVLVIHSHSDHTASDAVLRGRVATRVIEAQPQAIMQFFGLKTWPPMRNMTSSSRNSEG
jgi:hydroxyacylglutathione hydrolase